MQARNKGKMKNAEYNNRSFAQTDANSCKRFGKATEQETSSSLPGMARNFPNSGCFGCACSVGGASSTASIAKCYVRMRNRNDGYNTTSIGICKEKIYIYNRRYV